MLKGRGFTLDEILGMTVEQITEFYTRAVFARIHYMNDVRMGVWGDAKELDKYYNQITGR